MEASRAKTRVLHASRAVKRGKAILDFISTPPVRELLVAEAERGLPPVGGISEPLLKKFGHDPKSREEIVSLPVKQFVGLCVRAVLQEEGFEVAQKGVRVYDANRVFRVGSIYKRVGLERAEALAPSQGDLAEAMFARMSDDEALRAIRLIEKTHPRIRDRYNSPKTIPKRSKSQGG
jgi:hypothetical protein